MYSTLFVSFSLSPSLSLLVLFRDEESFLSYLGVYLTRAECFHTPTKFLSIGQAVKDLQVVHLAGEASKLVVIADSEIRAVPLHHCDSPAAANSCVACVALQDPHCAWDATMDLCVAVPTKLHDNDASKTLFQDIIIGKHKGCGAQQGK